MCSVDPLRLFPETAAALAASPVVVGHRGMGGRLFGPRGGVANLWTENTRASFLAAAAAGASWVELDVVPSADGDLFLCHDQFLAGVPVWETSSEVMVAAGHEPLEGLCAGLPAGLGLNVEVKTVPGDVDPHAGPPLLGPVLDWVWEHAGDRPVMVSSFAPHVAAAARVSGVPSAWLGGPLCGLFEAVSYAISARLQTVVVHSPTALEMVPVTEVAVGFALAARHNITVWAWDVAPEQVLDLVTGGVSGVIVDDVAGAVAMLAAPLTAA